jgi:hypothetical protein
LYQPGINRLGGQFESRRSPYQHFTTTKKVVFSILERAPNVTWAEPANLQPFSVVDPTTLSFIPQIIKPGVPIALPVNIQVSTLDEYDRDPKDDDFDDYDSDTDDDDDPKDDNDVSDLAEEGDPYDGLGKVLEE